MKQVVATGPELSMDERNVLSVAYKNKADDWFVDCDLLPFYMDMVWFDMICMWVGVDGLWLWRDLFMQLCNSFLTCMCAQTHLQVHRNFAQMQLVLVLMIDNLWGCSWLIKLPSHPDLKYCSCQGTQRHTPSSSIFSYHFKLQTCCSFKRSKTLGQVGMLRSAFRATSVASSKTASREEVEYAEEYKKKARTQWDSGTNALQSVPLYCGMSGVCSELFAHEVMSNITLSRKEGVQGFDNAW